MTRKSSTETLVGAMRILARDIQSGDGVANAAISEAADRLEELQSHVMSEHLRDATKMAEQQARISELEKRIDALLEQRNRMGQDVQSAAITGTIPPNHPFAAQLGLVANMRARIAELESLVVKGPVERLQYLSAANAALRTEAKNHAQEARTANATIAEIYQLVTGATGEPGNWHGTEPVRKRLAELERQAAIGRRAVDMSAVLEIIEQALPIWDGDGIDPKKHHCEWVLLNERHRARAEIFGRLRDAEQAGMGVGL